MAFNYTKNQQEAIFHEGENILVSAGAGSGKTAVLTERVIRKLKEGVPVESLIILTFTNAAAAEMKARIRRALMDNLAKSPDLKHALEGLDSAHIRTFDSYAFHLLKKYGYLKDISKQLTIGDEATFNLKKEALIDEVFERFFEKKDEAFKSYVSLFSHKDDTPAKRQILYFHEALSLHYDKEEFLEYTLHDYFNPTTFETLFSEYESIVLEQINTMKKRLQNLFDEGYPEEMEAYLEKLDQAFSPLFSCESYDCVHTYVKDQPRLPSTAGLTRTFKDTPDEEALEHLKAMTQTIKDVLKKELAGSPADPGPLQKSKQEHFHGFMATKDHIETIVRVLRTFDSAFHKMQKEEEVFDFSTVARLALDLIHEHQDVKKELLDSTSEIMVDEYQDTNAMQEAFLCTVGNNNLYMVGDVKQSIYRFRHADPTIFMEKYEAYKQDQGGRLIDLTDNFRSRSEVLDGVNRIFSAIMDETVGGVNYDARQALSAKNPVFDELRSNGTSYGLNVLAYREKDHESLLETFSKKELEMFLIARDIKVQVEKNAEIIGDDGLRPVTYGDHAVLMDRATDFGMLRKVFEYVGVPVNIHRNAQFIAHDEVILVRQILTLIAAMEDKDLYRSSFRHAFMSVMRSFAFERSDDAIVNQVMALPKNAPDALGHWVTPPFRDFFDTIEVLKEEARVMPVDELLHEVYDRFDLVKHSVRLSNTREAKARLDYMVELARSQAERGASLNTFAKHLEAVGKADKDIELALKSDFEANTVHVMTIHKSKGLEFPVVYVPHLFNKFMHDTSRERFKRSLGFLIPYDNEGYDEHFLYPLYRTLERTEDVSERLRVFYVALTRAKERVVLPFFQSETPATYMVDDADKVDVYERRRYKSFHAVIESVLDRMGPWVTHVELDAYHPDSTYRFEKSRRIPLDDAPAEKSYRYAGETPELEKRSAYSKGVSELVDKSTLEALDYGNRLHEMFERIDFLADIDEQLNTIAGNARERDLLKAFFDSDLIASLDIDTVYKEYPFALESEEGVRSGFIDLLLETKERFLVIDYKLKGIEDDAYQSQIEGYVHMLEEVVEKPVDGYLYSIMDKRFKKIM